MLATVNQHDVELDTTIHRKVFGRAAQLYIFM
jgi:hypothetical protein